MVTWPNPLPPSIVTIPDTVLQSSEIPEGLVNYSVYLLNWSPIMNLYKKSLREIRMRTSSSSIRPSGLLQFHSIFLTVFLGFFSRVVCSSKGCLGFC
jgi:hypothetical protein